MDDLNPTLGNAVRRRTQTIGPGLQANNGSPMGLGQPLLGKDQPDQPEAPEADMGVQERAQARPAAQVQSAPVPPPSAAAGDLVPASAPPAGAQPGYGQYRSNLEGFDNAKIDAGKQDPKYIYAQYASQYSPQQLATDPRIQQEFIARLRADPSGLFRNASWSGSDVLDVGGGADPMFNGITKFDVIRGAGDANSGYQWNPIDGPQGASAASHTGTPGPSFGNPGLGQAISMPLYDSGYDANSARTRLSTLLAQLKLGMK